MKLVRRAEREMLSRRQLLLRTLGAASALLLGGCERLSRTEWFPKVLGAAESVNQAVHKMIGRKAMAQEFSAADLSPTFRSNGTAQPENPAYLAMMQNQFADYQLQIDGLVEKPRAFSLAELRGLPSRTQITRHDCVEGWSAIGKWKGARLAALLEEVKPKPEARFVVFHCADPMEGEGSNPYYESIDMDDALHVQTILAYELNDSPLPVGNGAPIPTHDGRLFAAPLSSLPVSFRRSKAMLEPIDDTLADHTGEIDEHHDRS